MAKRKVLIVDDDSTNRQVISIHLTQLGYSCQEAENGKVALRILEEPKRPNLIISDVEMPEVNGIKLLTTVRVQYSEIPIIMMTGSPNYGHLRDLADGFLRKPFRLEELERAVKLVPLAA